jgi:phosphoribosyl 1,2-cyclic phosphate phosphodiesterase
MRSSILIQGRGGEQVVIDTGPEFRLQAIRAGIHHVDAVFLTHAHADHVHGLDDLRPLGRLRGAALPPGSIPPGVPVYSNAKTIDEIRERFSYIFRETQQGGGKPRLELLTISGPVRIGGLVFSPVPIKHGDLDILGWRIDEENSAGRPPLVYLTDITALPDTSRTLIEKPGILIIDGLRIRPHATHFSFEQALSTGAALGAAQIYLTHICHENTHRWINRFCRDFRRQTGFDGVMRAAWDGLTLYA